MITRADAERKLSAFGQSHVLRWFDELDGAGQERLLGQIEALDLAWLARVLETPELAVDPATITPYEELIPLDASDAAEARARGEAALRAGEVACILVAGGQGSRLGFDGPKGAFVLGPVSGRTLFQMHVERLVALGRRYGAVPPLYLMTSPDNHEATCRIFAEANRFGLPEDRLLIFPQGLAPAVDEQGRLLLEERGSLVLAANGNGGLFAALAGSGALAQMERLGIRAASYVQVDNPLSLSCDPRFVGYHLLRQSDYSCKAIPKVHPAEKVGAYARVGGRLSVVEYTVIPEALAESRDARGALRYGYANPGLFVWSVPFLREQAERADLPYHRAHKKIPHLDPSGRRVEPTAPCGYKLETFAMDTLPDAKRSLVLEIDRDEEFAPVKNASGVDSPDSARGLMTALYRRWITEAGGTLSGEGAVEVSPLYALDGEELAERLPVGFRAETPLYLGPKSPAR
ncbi:MAG: UTP--glucose-1-phosphate uridylyltransferase [Deltaproteobacteria bacterium]|nr:UTP--glucose-1-phosphate uridylyltransferase [Deltaproteobacteria bacterium]